MQQNVACRHQIFGLDQNETLILELVFLRLHLVADKLAFVGFKGSFLPDWVHLEVGADRAKIHQVLPVPVVHMMKL